MRKRRSQGPGLGSQRRKPAVGAGVSFVYIIRQEDTRQVKIGTARYPRRRLGTV
jgi:hypothetical protein